MSLAINAVTSEGLILAADSRQSYINQKQTARVGSDSASKLYKLSDRVGLAITGLAFLPENGTLKNVGRFVKEFKDSNDLEKLSVKEISEKLNDFFRVKYDYQGRLKELFKDWKDELKQQGSTEIDLTVEKDELIAEYKDQTGKQMRKTLAPDPLKFLLAGFDKDKKCQVYNINVPGKVILKRDSSVRNLEYGANWIGQGDVVSRIVLGFDGRISSLPFAKKLTQEIGEEKFRRQLAQMEYLIQWGTMTLQDGIDFSLLAIKTTIAIQRFSDGIMGNPGDIPGVGGPIDVAVITKDHGFVWISKKNLQAEGNKIDLDKVNKI